MKTFKLSLLILLAGCIQPVSPTPVIPIPVISQSEVAPEFAIPAAAVSFQRTRLPNSFTPKENENDDKKTGDVGDGSNPGGDGNGRTDVCKGLYDVYVYYDMLQVNSKDKIVSASSELPEFTFKYVSVDKNNPPVQVRGAHLPSVLFRSMRGGWKRLIKWENADSFRKAWKYYNDKDNNQSQATPKQMPKVSARTGYPTHPVVWHLVSEPETVASLIKHLTTPSSEHEGRSFNAAWVKNLNFEQLLSLHDDAHNHRVRWDWVPNVAAAKPPQIKAPRTQSPRARQAPAFCPTGNCPYR